MDLGRCGAGAVDELGELERGFGAEGEEAGDGGDEREWFSHAGGGGDVAVAVLRLK